MRTIGRLSGEGRNAVKEKIVTTNHLEDSSIADTASVVSDDQQHDFVRATCSGPLNATYEDSCEFCCQDLVSSANISGLARKNNSKNSGKVCNCNGEAYYTMCQVRRHNTLESCWLVAGDTIYDATPYLLTHPGGTASILRKGGGASDVTRDLQFHSAAGKQMFQKYIIGKVRPCGQSIEDKKPFWIIW